MKILTTSRSTTPKRKERTPGEPSGGLRCRDEKERGGRRIVRGFDVLTHIIICAWDYPSSGVVSTTCAGVHTPSRA